LIANDRTPFIQCVLKVLFKRKSKIFTFLNMKNKLVLNV